MDSRPAPSLAVVVFSKDRPLQLDATLRSLDARCLDLNLAIVNVLYKTSTPHFAAGYRILASEHPTVVLKRESEFRGDLLSLVDNSDYLLFVVDDTLFVGDLSLEAAIDVLARDPGCLGFSFRLGRNTTYCYPRDATQALPSFNEPSPGVLTFDWIGAEHDFGYPIEVSSSLYRTSDLLPLLRDLQYSDPNTLESLLAQCAGSFRVLRPRLACYERSVAVSVPANLVQTAWKNRVVESDDMSPEALARRYDNGDRLEVEKYRGLVPNACHQELEYHFERDTTVPTVSVVIRCYNQARYLPEAVRSVMAQTFTDWEIIVVDDGSPDDTAEVAGRLAGETSLSLVRQPNSGVSGAMDAGVAAARGRYILPLDADDMIAPDMLEKTVALLERESDIAIAYTDVQRFGGDHELVLARNFDARLLPDENQMSYCSLYRREVWDAAGGYNRNMSQGYEDWDFWISAAEHGYVGKRIPEALFYYRISASGMYAKARKQDTELRRQIRENHPASFGADDPVVSVIVPTHNYASYLAEALESVRGQSFASWECIVIDDGSTDETSNVIERWSSIDARIRAYHQPQRGLAATRNRGIDLSRGRYIQFLDSDDLLHPSKLEWQVAALNSARDVDIAYSKTGYFDDHDPNRQLRRSFNRDPNSGGLTLFSGTTDEWLARLVLGNVMTVAAPLVRSSVFDNVGMFDASLDRLEDWDMWLRCALAGRQFMTVPSDEYLAMIRVHAISMSAARTDMLRAEVRVRRRLRLALPDPLRRRNDTLLTRVAIKAALQLGLAGDVEGGLRVLGRVAIDTRSPSAFVSCVLLTVMLVPGSRALVKSLLAARPQLRGDW